MKKKIIIADDNLSVCDKISDTILSEELGLEIVSIVKEGNELRNLTETFRPDIIILDINLPNMNGLDSILEIKEIDIDIKIILIGEYRSFDFAFKAINYGVEGYLVKPIDIKELINVLRRVATQKCSIRKEQTYLRHIEAIRRMFVMKIMFEVDKLQMPLDELNMTYGTNFQDGIYRVVFVTVDSSFNRDFFQMIRQQLTKLHQICMSIINRYCYDVVYGSQYNGFKFLLNYAISNDYALRRELPKMLKEIKRVFENNKDIDVTLCVGGAYEKTENVVNSASEADTASWSRRTKGEGKVIYFEKEDDFPEKYKSELKLLSVRIKKASETLNPSEFRKGLVEFFSLPDSILARSEAKAWTDDIIKHFFSVNGEFIDAYKQKEIVQKEVIYTLLSSSTIVRFKNAFISQFTQMMERITYIVDKQKTRPIKLAMLYVKDNYINTIGIENISKEVNLSPGYFSALFKKETGQNFTEYVSQYRIFMSKALLKESDMNIGEISDAVGYSDQRYFSKTFKKLVGISPKDYRHIYK